MNAVGTVTRANSHGTDSVSRCELNAQSPRHSRRVDSLLARLFQRLGIIRSYLIPQQPSHPTAQGPRVQISMGESTLAVPLLD